MIFNKVPGKYIASDNPILVGFESSTTSYLDQRLTLNTIFEEVPIDNMTLDSVSLPYSRIDFPFGHNFTQGDTVLLYHSAGDYNGNYIVTESVNDSGPSDYYIVINLILTIPFDFDRANLGKTIKVSADKNPYTFDVSPVLKNKVFAEIQNTTLNYDGNSNKWDHRYLIGRDYNVQYNITDQVIYSGKVGFKTDVPFAISSDFRLQIGDEILLDIDDRVWEYDDNIFSASLLGFTSTNPHYLRENIPIFVNGQITEPSYNGKKVVDSILSTTSIQTRSQYVDSTPVEGGQIVYQAYPELNKRRVKITGFGLDGGYPNDMIVIRTDIPWIQNDPGIRGTATKMGDRFKTVNENSTERRILFNSSFEYTNYDPNAMADYVIKPFSIWDNITSLSNNISSIRNIDSQRENYNFIPFDGKEHLLINDDNSGVDKVRVTFKDRQRNVISIVEYQISLEGSVYYPVSIKDLLLNTSGNVTTGDPLSVIQNDVYYYEVDLLGDPNKALYFPNDGNGVNRELRTPRDFSLPAEYTNYLLFDSSEIQTNGTGVYDLITIDDTSLSLVYDNINQEFTDIRYLNDGTTYDIALTNPSVNCDVSNGDFFMFYIKMDTIGTNIDVGLANVDLESMPISSLNLIAPEYSSPLIFNPSGAGLPFVGTIYYFATFVEDSIRQGSTFLNTFGYLLPMGGLKGFDLSNTTQQNNIYTWWDFNEGSLYDPFNYAPNQDRYESLNGIRLIDYKKYGSPALESITINEYGNLMSNPTLYQVDKRCGDYQLPIYLSFVDSLGSLTSIPFKMKNKKYLETNKSSYYKQTDLTGTIKKGGQSNYHVKSRRVYTLITDFYTEQTNDNVTIEDLFKSIQVYIHLPASDELIPCNITNDSIEMFTSDDGVFNYQFDVMESIDNHRY